MSTRPVIPPPGALSDWLSVRSGIADRVDALRKRFHDRGTFGRPLREGIALALEAHPGAVARRRALARLLRALLDDPELEADIFTMISPVAAQTSLYGCVYTLLRHPHANEAWTHAFLSEADHRTGLFRSLMDVKHWVPGPFADWAIDRMAELDVGDWEWRTVVQIPGIGRDALRRIAREGHGGTAALYQISEDEPARRDPEIRSVLRDSEHAAILRRLLLDRRTEDFAALFARVAAAQPWDALKALEGGSVSDLGLEPADLAPLLAHDNPSIREAAVRLAGRAFPAPVRGRARSAR